jgi:TPR repeat protein/predicted esterase
MKRIPGNALLAWLTVMLVGASWLTPLSGAQELELKDEAGKTILRYAIEVPPDIAPAATSDPARQVGLILCSQEHDTPTGNDLFPVRQALIRQGQLDHYILLAPAPQGRKFGLADHEPIQKLIAWAIRTYPVNPRRVYMFGKGEGSKISMEFMMTHPDIVTAAVGYSWGAWLMPSELKEPLDFANRAPEIYLTLGRRDLAHHLTCVRDAYRRLTAKGYHLIYREFDELADRSYHPPSNDDALAWATRLRNKNIPPSAAEAKLLEAVEAAPQPAKNGYFPALALVGGAPAGAVLEKLFLSKDAAIRAAAAETCQHGIFGASTAEALAKLTSDPSPKVRQTSIRALAMYANWRYRPAQDALIRLAAATSADARDRLNAADGLAYAVRLQVQGARQDVPLFQALISLLKDEEEPIRSTAFLALAPAYEPAPAGDKRRRSPQEGWEKWLEQAAALQNDAVTSYEFCGQGPARQAAEKSENAGKPEAADLFCKGGSALLGRNLATGQAAKADLASAFQWTLKAAEHGYVPAQSAVALMYANGKGVQQSYPEAGKWWLKAASGGDLTAARYAWNLYRNGEGVDRDRTLANQMAALIGEPLQAPRAPTSGSTENTNRTTQADPAPQR